MQKAKRIRNQRKRGFTLIEVLLVVGIIALLAAFVAPALMGQRKKAERQLAQTAVSSSGPIATAIDLYRLSMGKYPEELKDLVTKPDDEEEAAKWGEAYIKDPSTLKDPWGNEYQYKSPGEVNTDSYDLWSMGPDGEDGTDDDIKNYKSE